jgi:hypothetical protein
VDEMVDAHLINIALAGLGISAAAAIVIAAAIIGISAIVLHGRSRRTVPYGTGLRAAQGASADRATPAERNLVAAGERHAA